MTKEKNNKIKELIQLAITLGANDARTLPISEIPIKPELALICNGDNPCPNYGLSLSCPPFVEGPSAFKQWKLGNYSVLIVKIDFPSYIIHSSERFDIMRLLHEIVVKVEEKAYTLGYEASIGLAGGSCKELFCHMHNICKAILNKNNCRNKDKARASMSGFGIDVSQLMLRVGWSCDRKNNNLNTSGDNSMTWLIGMILLM